MHVYRASFGLTLDELRDLAEVILRRDVVSLKTLEDAEVNRMLDALEGATLVQALLLQRA